MDSTKINPEFNALLSAAIKKHKEEQKVLNKNEMVAYIVAGIETMVYDRHEELVEKIFELAQEYMESVGIIK